LLGKGDLDSVEAEATRARDIKRTAKERKITAREDV
jgi:hypothetical protein